MISVQRARDLARRRPGRSRAASGEAADRTTGAKPVTESPTAPASEPRSEPTTEPPAESTTKPPTISAPGLPTGLSTGADGAFGAAPAAGPGGAPGDEHAGSGSPGWGDGRAGGVALRLVRPFAWALWRGDADPPPSPRRLAFNVPSWLAVLVPLRTVNLLQLAELVLAFALFGVTQSMVNDWNLQTRLPVGEQFTYLTALAVALPVALRDRWPLAAWRVAFVSMPLVLWVAKTAGPPGALPYAPPVTVAYLLVLYSVAVRCDRQITWVVWILTVLTAWIADPNSMPLVSVVTAVAVLFGHNVRVRRSTTAKLVVEERRSQVAESAKAVLAERTRIARELHDVVAHHMSVIAIQAEAVPLKAAGDPVQLEAGLAEIRGLSLEAIAELRQVLGVLRDQDGRTDTAPQPGLDRVDELFANARAAGLAVLVKRSGSLDGLPPAVELSAYRIVQESLSNVMRHAPGAPVAVDIAREGNELRLSVANGPGSGSGGSGGSGAPADGPADVSADVSADVPHEASRSGARQAGRETAHGSGTDTAREAGQDPARGAGQGLVGMRERAALLEGSLDAGPVCGGGFEVRAVLPIVKRENA
ncbi:histidine kinase [Nonomuraea sp. B1E8]|uniref:sensor histidine kinase n=1 Tax=unclassified Nonomuraea TaxID=2593643 RepID=UPI00325C591E